VKPSSRRSKLVVAVDGAGIANHAGSAALAELADTLGWTQALVQGDGAVPPAALCPRSRRGAE
jgi:hypothetical protein